MYVKISQDKLSQMINIAGKGISPNSPLPALSGIKFDIRKDYMECTGSDANISIQVREDKNDSFVYDVEEEGSIIINKSYISEIIKKIDSDVVTMEIGDTTMTRISGNKAQFDINGFRGSDYPLIDFTTPEQSFEMDASLLKTIVSETYFAASFSEARPVLTGINLRNDGETLTVVSTDSYRLARKELKLHIPFEFNITVLAKSLLDIARAFNDDEKVRVAMDSKKAQFFNDRLMIQTRLIDGTYPDTSRFIPASFPYELVLEKRDLISAINRSSFIKSENDQYAILKLSMDEHEIVMSSRSQEIGSSKENLSAESYKGEHLELFFSSKYVSEALNGLEGDKIRIQFAGQVKPFILTSLSDDTTLQLVLPVRAYN